MLDFDTDDFDEIISPFTLGADSDEIPPELELDFTSFSLV